MSKDVHKAASKYSKILLENDSIRVIELNWKKGLKIDMHSHPKYFTYAITPLKYKSTSPDGKTQSRSMKKGEITWYDAESHSVESTGTTGRALVVELK
jgi:beta-alanine degradation protein BauB